MITLWVGWKYTSERPLGALKTVGLLHRKLKKSKGLKGDTGNTAGREVVRGVQQQDCRPGQAVPAMLRRLAELHPSTLAIMHGGSYRGDGGAALRALADAYESEFPVTRMATS